ncbi:MAG: C39 family peptidase [Clostridiales bacterium]|nr:C39 family peptidase [Clostridiales bacterium]
MNRNIVIIGFASFTVFCLSIRSATGNAETSLQDFTVSSTVLQENMVADKETEDCGESIKSSNASEAKEASSSSMPSPTPEPSPSISLEQDELELAACFEVHNYSEAMEKMDIPDVGIFYLQTALKTTGSALIANESKPLSTFVEEGSFIEALDFAKEQSDSYIYCRKRDALLWDNLGGLPASVENYAPQLLQMPELPRGCEVTSLAMLIGSYGLNIDKIELSQRIAKDDTPYERKKGAIYYGNPNTGFVGSMLNLSKNGYGVYHEPIYNLLKEYAPEAALDLTGCDFDDVMYFLSSGAPVWIITNARYTELPKSQFVEWITPEGRIEITYREHSVLVTGYDSSYIYFNDPMGLSERAPRERFIKAWEQMGRQAVTLV